MSKHTFKLIPTDTTYGSGFVLIDAHIASALSPYLAEFYPSDDDMHNEDVIEIPLAKGTLKGYEIVVKFVNLYYPEFVKHGQFLLQNKETAEKHPYPLTDIPKPLRSHDFNADENKIGEDFAKFIDMPLDDIVVAMLAANFILLTPLVDLCASRIAHLIHSRPIQEVKKEFGVDGEFTPGDFEAVQKEYPFLKDS